LGDSISKAKNEKAMYEQSLALAPGDHLIVRYSQKQPSHLWNQVLSLVAKSTSMLCHVSDLLLSGLSSWSLKEEALGQW
jgi:hypothetical protein